MEERALDRFNQREAVDAMMATPGLDERGPFLELGEAGCAVGLAGKERGEGVGWWELEGCCGVRLRLRLRLRHLLVSGAGNWRYG